MQIDVCQYRADYSLDTNDNFEFEQVVVLKKRKEK
jgi:hypothetical protein